LKPPEIIEVDVEHLSARFLIAALDEDLRSRYPGEPIYGIEPTDFRAAKGLFVVALDGQAPVACGAYHPQDARTVEIKRVFVVPTHRRRGYSRAILACLERRAADHGFARAILETADRQPEAIVLYRSAGYTDIAPFGRYANDPRSVYLGKDLRFDSNPA